jgi:hypothetical protein
MKLQDALARELAEQNGCLYDQETQSIKDYYYRMAGNVLHITRRFFIHNFQQRELSADSFNTILEEDHMP